MILKRGTDSTNTVAETTSARIARNTGWLFLRTVVGLFTGLLAVRMALNALGVSGYGVYVAVYGVVSFVTTFNGVLRDTARRFLGTALGSGDPDKVAETFSAVWTLTVLLVAALALVGEGVGLFLLRNYLTLPEGQEGAACIVLHASLMMVLAQTLVIPFIARIVVGERMAIFLVVGLVESVLTLAAAGAAACCPAVGVEVYAGVLALGVTGVSLFYVVHSRRHFADVGFGLVLSRRVLRPLGSFFSWSLLGSLGNVAKYQCVCLLVNHYAGVAYNASWDLGIRVWSFFYAFGTDFQQAFCPALFKAWASDARRFTRLVVGTTGSVLLFLGLPALVACLFAPELLVLWLGTNLPPQGVAFVRCALVNLLVDVLSQPLTTAILASGRVACYQLVASTLSFCAFVGAWSLLTRGAPPWQTMGVVAAANALACAYRVAHVAHFTSVRARRVGTDPSAA